ncbi:PREDICTED: disintegrin and metalloproteinase domain-containing protein 32 [Condylura cristata]|uniref:disintegrin and metalloproteinase domain-containing protein 32 n=1 Tax=Condylura cristata TaxID=143302 RepID=UPI0006432F4E|nr:PREDICTED: disintegrin and metalloproteinase domain-containing protein 32 [Condylura cristata]
MSTWDYGYGTWAYWWWDVYRDEKVNKVKDGKCSQNSFLQIIFPEKIQANTSNNSKIENEQISYIIPIDEKPYIVHLKQRLFLAENFMVYLYNQGSLTSHHSESQTQCYYQGYIEGYPNSVATLNTCSGLRGILQFENASYVIEPLESEVEFQHLLYKLRNENNDSAILTLNDQGMEQNPMDYNIFISGKPEPAVSDLTPLYLEMHIVVDKILYDFLGSDGMIVTNKVIEIIGLVNSLFAQFKVTIVLSSLELWSDKNKISTVGEADELLHAFLEWKKSYLTLRPHDIAYLFIYREYPDYVGATFPGKMCVTQHSAGIVLYSKKITLEAFSVIVTQMLGLSLGISYDDPKKCQCPGVVCIMNPEAMQFSGVKMFSSCSLRDFENFLSNMGAKCLQNKPQMQSAKQYTCGNGKVEGQETCDCGTIQQCAGNVCCDPLTCQLRPGAQCDKGRCCKKDCKFQSPGYECRHRVHPECDISEFCNGTSAQCEPDITIHNGRLCKKGKFMCYDGDCQDLDARCESIFGKGSKNAPFFCYEEVHSQSDRFGNCGFADNKYVMCMWRNLMCGRLVCTYPTRTPFQKENTSVIYAYLRDTVCITADYRVSNPQKDPMIIRSGSVCDTGRVCVSTQCVEARWIEYQERDCTKKCSGNGVCNSKKQCHCFAGYKPPNCAIYGRTSSELPGKHGLIMERTLGNSPWILIVYTALPVLTIGIIIAVSWNSLKKRFTKEEESISSETESSTHTYASSSRSESSDQTDITRTRSEVSTQMDISRSKSQYSTQTPESSN